MATRPGNGLAVATLVCGILGLLLGVLVPMAFSVSLVAVVLGAMSVGPGGSNSPRWGAG
jgi:hypothetical protein